MSILLQLDSLSDAEQTVFSECLRRIEENAQSNQLRTDLYESHRKVKDLGISTPPQLKNVETVLGWPGLIIDALSERLSMKGFVIPGGDTASFGLDQIWDDNELAVVQTEAHDDAFLHGVSFLATSAGDTSLGEPEILITPESALSMSGIWDRRRRCLSAALAVTGVDGDNKTSEATLYLPYMTVRVARVEGAWVVIDRQEHPAPRPLIRRLVNRSRGSRQWGRSEITRAVISYTDSAMRTLLGAETNREFYNSPQRYIMGADEDTFKDRAGKQVNPWTAMQGAVLALSRDEVTGDMPEVGTFTTQSPQPYVELIRMYSQLIAGEAGIPAHYLGFVTDNPASADQIRAVEARHVKRAERRQDSFGLAWRGAALDAVLLRDGEVPEPLTKLRVRWQDASTPTRAASADAVMKLVAAGVLPADSDVTLEMLDFDATEIERIRADRKSSGANAPMPAGGPQGILPVAADQIAATAV